MLHNEKRDQRIAETHVDVVAPAADQPKIDAHEPSVGGPSRRRSSQRKRETQASAAGAAADQAPDDAHGVHVGGTHSNHGHNALDAHLVNAGTVAADQTTADAQRVRVGGGHYDQLVDTIIEVARRRKFAMKVQQKLDRALESYVRREKTPWRFDMPEEEREKWNEVASGIIKRAAKGEYEDQNVTFLVQKNEESRDPWDRLRASCEKEMERMAGETPVAEWVEGVRGVGLKGLAIILGETGSLDNYANPAKIWKRLGFAPYDGHAGSTWKRDKWRPRTLTSEEWVDNPFSGRRYAEMAQIATWLRTAQWVGKEKDPNHRGYPTGHYGEVYADRKAHTLEMHPEWYQDSKGKIKKDKFGNPTSAHAEKDALRVMMKKFLKDLWVAWRSAK